MNTLSAPKEIAFIAIMCAILIAGQLALSAVAGIEIVTVLLLCFSFCIGPRGGALCAVAFSILRCFIWGFYPTAIVLYLIYYPTFALTFGFLGKLKDSSFNKFWIVGILSLALCALCVCLNLFDVIKISRLYKTAIQIFLWVLAALFFALFLLFIIKKDKKIVCITAIAAIFTICFTLLDDVITPLFLGWTFDAAIVYFYASFMAMLPQTVCAIVTVFTLFYPLNKVFLILQK